MKHRVKLIMLQVVMAVGLYFGTLHAGESKVVVDGNKSGGLGSLFKTEEKDTRLTGTLGEGIMKLELDSPMYFVKGSKSERVVTGVRLIIPGNLREKAMKLERKHVAVVGPMVCTMEFSPWIATCELTIKQIDLTE